MATKRSVRKRVAKALKKYVRGNAGRRDYGIYPKYAVFPGGVTFKSKAKAIKEAREGGGSYVEHLDTHRVVWERKGKQNPLRVKGRKTKGGRAVTLRNFTGTIVKKSDGTVQIVGRGRRK